MKDLQSCVLKAQEKKAKKKKQQQQQSELDFMANKLMFLFVHSEV